MPLYEFECVFHGHRQDHWLSIDRRNRFLPSCVVCGDSMKRLPGGHKMLHFEEGRGRVHIGLSDKPITSYAQQQKLMKARGAVEGGNTVPPSVARNPKSLGLKQFMAKDHKGRWV